jgi:uncharacterized protein YggE
MENIIKNHIQEHYYNANVRTLIQAKIVLLLVFFLLIGCNSEIEIQEIQNSVSVSGIGSVMSQPDMVLMNVSFSHTAPTTQEAKKAFTWAAKSPTALGWKER